MLGPIGSGVARPQVHSQDSRPDYQDMKRVAPRRPGVTGRVVAGFAPCGSDGLSAEKLSHPNFQPYRHRYDNLTNCDTVQPSRHPEPGCLRLLIFVVAIFRSESMTLRNSKAATSCGFRSSYPKPLSSRGGSGSSSS